MPRTYTAKRLLEHGPLTLLQFVEITGWKYSECRKTLSWLQECGAIVFDGAWRLL